MQYVTAPQKTFGKQTKQFIQSLVPTAAHFVKIGKDVLIKDKYGDTLATWTRRHSRNPNPQPLIIIWRTL
jgi:hypothetical protein